MPLWTSTNKQTHTHTHTHTHTNDHNPRNQIMTKFIKMLLTKPAKQKSYEKARSVGAVTGLSGFINSEVPMRLLVSRSVVRLRIVRGEVLYFLLWEPKPPTHPSPCSLPISRQRFDRHESLALVRAAPGATLWRGRCLVREGEEGT